MRYKTTIKIVTEASDKDEAAEIAGEYLSGNLTSGVDMHLCTAPVISNGQRAGLILTAVLLVAFLAIPLTQLKHARTFVSAFPETNVIQPPLNTSSAETKFSDFKSQWQTKHAEEAFHSIRK
ncbi:MAG: hypothetical protein WC522_02165 [Candidatus Omnitrophota bacterium]